MSGLSSKGSGRRQAAQVDEGQVQLGEGLRLEVCSLLSHRQHLALGLLSVPMSELVSTSWAYCSLWYTLYVALVLTLALTLALTLTQTLVLILQGSPRHDGSLRKVKHAQFWGTDGLCR